MKQWITDMIGLGTGFWLLGYILSIVLFFSPYARSMGWILLSICTPVTLAITWWWFRARDHPRGYYLKVGVAWTILAIVLDFLFIVVLLQATYYGADVFVYYVLTFLIPVGVGYYLAGRRENMELPLLE
jgi:nicotinamide riboside transporter PnuC